MRALHLAHVVARGRGLDIRFFNVLLERGQQFLAARDLALQHLEADALRSLNVGGLVLIVERFAEAAFAILRRGQCQTCAVDDADGTLLDLFFGRRDVRIDGDDSRVGIAPALLTLQPAAFLLPVQMSFR